MATAAGRVLGVATAVWVGLLATAVPAHANDLPSPPSVDQYSVTYTTASTSSLGAMPVGNGRVSVNAWVDGAAPGGGTGDLMLLIGLADALDENSNLLKLGLIRLALSPRIEPGGPINQTLVLSTGTVVLKAGGVEVSVWVDANTSSVRMAVTPSPAGPPVGVTARLDHDDRLAGVIDAGGYGNGWGGPSGSFCNPNGTIADFVGIFPDALHPTESAVVWYHRNDPRRSDMYHETLRAQGLEACGEGCWDPITNRSWGAALVGDAAFTSANATTLVSSPGTATVNLALAVASAQTDTLVEFTAVLDALVDGGRVEIDPSALGPRRATHEAWWADFWARSYIHVRTPTPPPPAPSPPPPPPVPGYTEHNDFDGDQSAVIENPQWPNEGKSPGKCSVAFPNKTCVAEAAAMCDAVPGCVAFSLSTFWHGGFYPVVYTSGTLERNSEWSLFVNASAVPPSPPPPPPLAAGMLVSRQYVLMRFMDLCSSGRIGGGLDGNDFFALKYNGGILTSEPVANARSWGPGQWWQNLRLPYYAMLAEGGADVFRPLLRWYRSLLPLALRRTALWFNTTDAAGRKLSGVHGAFFHETETQFGTLVPSEKGYNCPAVRNSNWTVDWAGNHAINLHRMGSIELLMLGLDYFDHTEDTEEFTTSILPLAVGVTDWVATYYGRSTDRKLDVWPTQSLEGYRPGGFPPTRNNTIQNDMPWVAGLTAVLPRLVASAEAGGVDPNQVAKWQELIEALPALPTTSNGADGTVFTAAEMPYPPGAILGGSEQPNMYPMHPFRLATALRGGPLQQIGLRTITAHPNYGTGWYQGVMNVALLGMAEDAAAAVLARASTPTQAMRFPAYLPSMQDFRPNEDHLSNMRSALQNMLVQHDPNGTIGLLPAWPCGNWSVSFKLHLPKRTVLEGQYNHSTGRLGFTVDPPSRRGDVVVMRCA